MESVTVFFPLPEASVQTVNEDTVQSHSMGCALYVVMK